MAPLRILFVDDEPSIRLTLPEILRMHGHSVRSASTVAEALGEIQNEKFDVLISDLNIGAPGDGFTVVSAMRRTQPECVTLILTGYPGFETALQAIRSQVDDYLVKPAEVQRLVETIETRLRDRKPHSPPRPKRLAELVKECIEEIVRRTAVQLKKPKNKAEQVHSLTKLVTGIADALNGSQGAESPASIAEKHGEIRRIQGYTLENLFDEFRIMERVVYDIAQENLLGIEVSMLVPDLREFNDALQDLLRIAINAFLNREQAA
jgi:YesN/AraC family two-component response regulator